jgi:deoxyribodipyrimidine photo-lyase
LRTLFCFTRNLRLSNFALLSQACEESDEILFVVSWADLACRAGKFRKQFLIESLVDLQQQLKAFDQKLYITSHTLLQFIVNEANSNIQKIYIEEDVNFEEQVLIEKIKKIAQSSGINFTSIKDSTLTEFEATFELFGNKNIIFTDFRKKVEKKLSIKSLYNKIEKIPRHFGPIQNESFLNLEELHESHCHEQNIFRGGETKALKHLGDYFNQPENALNYKKTRNGMIRFLDSTKFSPWLSLGCISAQKVYACLKDFEKFNGENDSTYWIFFELLWRDYFKYYSFLNKNKLFTQNGIQNQSKKKLPRNIELKLFNQWKTGATGVDFIDANMIELNQTGWMSNRGRQNVASFLVHHLKVDWRLGAAYFEEMLIDYDCASNWGNWSYLAGVGTDPRHRVFNAEKQAQDYDPQKEYVNKWLLK